MSRKIAVGQAGGPTSVINDGLAGVIYESRLRELKLIGLKNGFEGGGLNPSIRENLVDLSDLTDSKIISLRGIPGAYLGTTRLKLKSGIDDEKILLIRKNLDSLGIECVFYIGGNDSADVIMAEGKGIHIAKTEDNDLQANDHTPGWGSACLANASIVRALHHDMSGFNPRVIHHDREVYSKAPVVVYQTQGRDTGWLALGCAFAKMNQLGEVILDAPPHLFLPRETAYNEKSLLDKVDNLLSMKGYAFIVCGEELVNSNNVPLAQLSSTNERKDEHNHIEHGRSGAFNYAQFIASTIKEKLRIKAETPYLEIKETPITPQHIQRSLMRSLVDGIEAFNLGRAAVAEFCDNSSSNINFSMGLQRIGKGYHIVPARIPLEKVAGKIRPVDVDYIGDIRGPTEKFYEDFFPLLGEQFLSQGFCGPNLRRF